jgi:hypothetical protein
MIQVDGVVCRQLQVPAGQAYKKRLCNYVLVVRHSFRTEVGCRYHLGSGECPSRPWSGLSFSTAADHQPLHPLMCSPLRSGYPCPPEWRSDVMSLTNRCGRSQLWGAVQFHVSEIFITCVSIRISEIHVARLSFSLRPFSG